MPQIGSHGKLEQLNDTICSALALSLIRLDRGTALSRMHTVAANNTPLLTHIQK